MSEFETCSICYEMINCFQKLSLQVRYFDYTGGINVAWRATARDAKLATEHSIFLSLVIGN